MKQTCNPACNAEEQSTSKNPYQFEKSKSRYFLLLVMNKCRRRSFRNVDIMDITLALQW